MPAQCVTECVSRRWIPAVCLLVALLGSLLLAALTRQQLRSVNISKRELSTNSMGSSSSTLSQVRLVNGRHRCEGRVEVQHNDTWGTVCDDDWDMVDANVVCRQLDCGLAMAVGSSSQFGQGAGPILLDNVDCKGGETDLGQCGSLGWGIHNCYHYEDVSVTCKDTSVLDSRGIMEPTTPSNRNSGLRDGTIRLIGGLDSCQGRVEVYYRGSWGTVCDDDWGLSDAGVVCQQIGCGNAVSATTNAFFGYGTGLILLDNVNCNGYESQLTSCYSLGWSIHNCGHHEDAGVICSGSGSTTVPLMNTEPLGGRGFFWTDSTPGVTDATVPVTGTTTKATTTAMTTKEQPPIRLVNGGNNTCQGRVEVYHNNVWGTVCDDDWDLANAQVVCRQLGCGPAIAAKVLAYFGYGSGPILLDNVDCSGNEADLTECFNLGWAQHNCGHHEDAGVICAPVDILDGGGRDFYVTQTMPTPPPPSEGQVRLVGGQHRCEGRVEMFSRAAWGTVCDDAWDLPDAQVVCRQLGCGPAAAARIEAFFGPGAGTILLDNLKCTGAEGSLQQCSHISWNVHNCDHTEDAGVTCSLS
ncbi:scavenger receptor cysteine-rich domain-containing group B protein [Osmerus mordax]|uniref:scavenger receptor cysteine-rich domain-containing group B protein n=1 Tax=Osmerus mordax TaxID=8014 RepID=UPI0035104D14